jgi:GT2 family glycosyltransferase
MELSIVVVSYQNRALLEKCLESLEEHLEGVLDYEVWVVDNASTDGTPGWLTAHAQTHPRVRPLLNPRNSGFAAANNLALPHCRGEFLLLLNNDALLTDASVTEGIRFLREHPRAFGCGGLLLNPDLSRGVSYGTFPGVATVAREITGPGFACLRGQVPAEGEGSHPVDFPCGALFLASTARAREIGPLDERFFLYFEETDWALRAWKAGYSIHYLPAFRAVHIGGASYGKEGPLAVVGTFHESWFLYVRKHSPAGAALALLAMLASFYFARMLASTLRRNGSFASDLKNLRGLFWGFAGKPSRRLAAGRP